MLNMWSIYDGCVQYVDMNKPAGGRVSGPALGGGPQSFNVPRAQPVRASQVGSVVHLFCIQRMFIHFQLNLRQ